MTFKGQYQCRLCGEIEENPVTGSSHKVLTTTVSLVLDIPCSEPQRPTMYGIHNCKDGSTGISDFKGWQIYNE